MNADAAFEAELAAAYADDPEAFSGQPLEATIRARAERIRSLEAERATLAAELQQAQQAGATTAQLVDWTGMSRRTVFYMLKRAT